jgi:hypothetical protein
MPPTEPNIPRGRRTLRDVLEDLALQVFRSRVRAGPGLVETVNADGQTVLGLAGSVGAATQGSGAGLGSALASPGTAGAIELLRITARTGTSPDLASNIAYTFQRLAVPGAPTFTRAPDKGRPGSGNVRIVPAAVGDYAVGTWVPAASGQVRLQVWVDEKLAFRVCS